ncbi:hypothetical protein BJ138DRAFT_1114893 [Hygrophoropsis aurantiaca]|uniref:Uncharacterized protein n=1 Tax=Hygrophoropsis aurantiaca TaxID=72124 RepID=A0ACB8A956_9AGAM|nr:hypothetical protein BJ138DRAFT_1114893 [Hygrophoropsis aurantiaca]
MPHAKKTAAPIPIVALHDMSCTEEFWALQQRLDSPCRDLISTGRTVAIYHKSSSFYEAENPQPAATGYIKRIMGWNKDAIKFKIISDDLPPPCVIMIPVEDCRLGFFVSFLHDFTSPFLSPSPVPPVIIPGWTEPHGTNHRCFVRDSNDSVMVDEDGVMQFYFRGGNF